MELLDRFRGALVGLAVGDALGHPTEFLSLVAIRERFGPDGVTGFERAGAHAPGTFTDDTQMAIAVARALVQAGHLSLDELMPVMAAEFVAWSRSMENDRAPGGACMSGCASLRSGTAWRKAGVAGSKGCGAAMRAAPIGLFHCDRDDLLVRVAAAQSAPTHRHPTGYASSVAAAAAAAWAARGGDLDGLLPFVRAKVERLNVELLVELGCDAASAERYGVGEMVNALDRTRDASATDAEDVCRLLGGAWVGEEAAACALWCVIRSRGRFRETVLRAANSSGDSDSIACIAGGIAGAMGGLQGIPDEWVRGVEQCERLDALARALHDAATGGGSLTPGPELAFFTPRSVAASLEDEGDLEREDDLEGEDDEGTLGGGLDEEGDAVEEAPDENADARALGDLDELTVPELEERIAHHNRRYWDDDAPEISDTAYDLLVRRLKARAPESPILSAMGPTMPATGAAVRHARPMLSLDKCYSDEELAKWAEGVEGDLVGMPKFDGVACSLHYDARGVLRLAATRGDGAVGDDITRNAWATAAIPRRLAIQAPLEVRGEIYMRLSVFGRFKANGMANPRNLAAGAIKQKDPARCAAYELSFVAYDAAFGGEATQAGILDRLAELGFEAIERVVVPRAEAATAYVHFAGKRASLDYEIDGVVLKANLVSEQQRLGETAHHPRHAIAYKFQGESGTSVLRAVEWSVARTGAITPVAVVDPVPLSGVTVTRASLHHPGFVRKLGLTIGARVLLTRRGGVIPNVEGVVEPGTQPVEAPEACPACGGAVRAQDDFLFCAAPADCRQATIGRLSHWAGTTGMIGFGPAILEQAYDGGLLRTPADFYRLNPEPLARLDRCGEKMAAKLVAEAAGRRSLALDVFLRALGVAELGRQVSGLLASRYSSLDAVLAATEEELAAIHSIGPAIARAVVQGLAEVRPLVDELRGLVTVAGGTAAAASRPAGPLTSRTFVFTGTLEKLGRKEAAAIVQELGGRVADSVGADVSHVVLGAAARTSSKEKAARRLVAEGAALRILSEAEFLAMVEELRAQVTATGGAPDAAEAREQLKLF